MTSAGVRQKRLFVVDGYLFTGFNIAPRKKQNVAIKRFHVSVGTTGVVDVVCAIAANRTVETPLAVNVANPEVPSTTRPLHCFPI